MPQSFSHGLQLLPLLPGKSGDLLHAMGNTGASQLHIGNILFSAQIQHPGQIQLHPVLLMADPPAGYDARIGLHSHAFPGDAVFIGEAADAAASVAAHLTTGAIGIVKMQTKIRNIRVVHRHEAIGAG